jgi:hypothetical protein
MVSVKMSHAGQKFEGTQYNSSPRDGGRRQLIR